MLFDGTKRVSDKSGIGPAPKASQAYKRIARAAGNAKPNKDNLYKKKLHSTDGGATFLQTITYTYNERGWLTRAQADKLDLNCVITNRHRNQNFKIKIQTK